VDQVRFVTRVADARSERPAARAAPARPSPLDRDQQIAVLERQMREAAAELDFELAARLRDELFELKAAGDPVRREPAGAPASPGIARTRRRRRG
jgi:excinuclease ABC subunit B